MTITLTPETEAKLREWAERDGEDINALADALIAAALEGAQDRAPGIGRGRHPVSNGDRDSRLARECAKLDPREEQTLAEEGMAADSAIWPQY